MRLLIAVTLGVILGVGPLAAAGELSGRRAPGFSLPDGEMKYHDLADHRGKVVVLEIMLTKCPNCQKLAQTLEKLKQKYGDKVAVLAVVNPPDNRVSVDQFKATYGVTTPILFDCGQMVGSYLMPNPERPRIHVPHLFLIDGDGNIRNDFDYSSVSDLDTTSLEAEIERLLKE
jgi:peroxiredoxin